MSSNCSFSNTETLESINIMKISRHMSHPPRNSRKSLGYPSVAFHAFFILPKRSLHFSFSERITAFHLPRGPLHIHFPRGTLHIYFSRKTLHFLFTKKVIAFFIFWKDNCIFHWPRAIAFFIFRKGHCIFHFPQG